MQRTIRLIALCAAIGCGGENGASTDFAQHHQGREELAPDTFVPNPLCTNNPIGSTWDPAAGLPSRAALSQLSPSGTKLRIGWRLAQKTLGFRYLMDVIPLDGRQVRGSHGRLPDDPAHGPILLGSVRSLAPAAPPAMTDVFELILRHLEA